MGLNLQVTTVSVAMFLCVYVTTFYEPRAHLQVAVYICMCVAVYVTTFSYLSLCEPMSA